MKKNPHAVALGRLGGSANTEAQKEARAKVFAKANDKPVTEAQRAARRKNAAKALAARKAKHE